MIDLLVCAPDRVSLIGLGVLTGFLPPDTVENVPSYAPPLNIHEIGEHRYNAWTDEEPDLITVPGWWVMLSAPDGTPIPEQLTPMIVPRDPLNPAVPNRVWF